MAPSPVDSAILFFATEASYSSAGAVDATGIGYSVLTTPVGAIALVALIDVRWKLDEAHFLTIDLADPAGAPVTVPGNGHRRLVGVRGIQVKGRRQHPGLIEGTPYSIPYTVTLPGDLHLTPRSRYAFRLHIDDQVVATRTFYVSASRGRAHHVATSTESS